MKRIKTWLHLLFMTNLIQTLRFNWKMLPVRQAWHLPIYFYGKTTFRSLTGKVIIEGPVRRGMIKVGRRDHYLATAVPWTIWTVQGTIVFTGRIDFWMGSYVLVSGGAVLRLGHYPTFIGSNVRILCFDQITIGNNVRITWDAQLIDTSFHYIQKGEDGRIDPLTKPVVIGDNVWIGNRSTLSKGTVIPSWTIVASNSMVNKDFSDLKPFTLLAGSPAVVKGIGIERIFDRHLQQELDEQFHYYRTHL